MKWIDKNLHIKPINTHIDPYKPVENAIITHGHADHAKPGHKNVLATSETIEIMKIRYGENCAENFQILPTNQSLKINDVLIKFFPAVKFTPDLPPIDESIIDNNVVGILI